MESCPLITMSAGLSRGSTTAGQKGAISLKTSNESRHHLEETNKNNPRKPRRASVEPVLFPSQPDDNIKKSTSMRTATQQTLTEICSACAKPITDRYILRALEQSWHWACLVCSVCRGILSELGSSLFVRGDLVLCRRDYIRLFGSGGQCSGCLGTIASHECVRRARDLVFHPECFNCFRCGRRFCTGDRFYLEDNRPMCEAVMIDPTVCATSRSDLQSLGNEKVTGSSCSHQTVMRECRFSMAPPAVNTLKENGLPVSSVSTYDLCLPIRDGASTIPHQPGLHLQEAMSESSFATMTVHCEESTRISRQTQVH
ncbi:actin-binding LIM protein 1-like isoform X2 [Varroa jacobsoni]|uniref:actin-binding LIM protein 1-like isoform X2 n=1 Tax=Varroa jacobsoni TaxID=62625 RepID=UPI000BF780C2|nr:actin-binding LIM protein 1-like isoform X2 [Varroa jacobsoni]